MYTDALKSKIPYVRINDNPWNKKYQRGNLPKLIKGALKDYPHIFEKWVIKLHTDIIKMEKSLKTK